MKKILVLLLAAVMIFSLIGCGASNTPADKPAETPAEKPAETPAETPAEKPAETPAAGGQVKVVIWGINPMSVGSGDKEMIAAFEKAYPNIKLDPQTTPGTGGYATQDVTKLLAAIAGGTPPQLTTLDRFTAAQFSARNALTPMNEYVEATGLKMSDFYEYATSEATFDGKVWAMPNGIDDRPLYWNKDLFAKEGLDPEKAPNTWDELLDYSKKLTKTDAKGNLKQIGFIPNFGNSWLYLYGWQAGAKFLSEDGKTALLNAPEVVKALEFMVQGYELNGGAKRINAYSSTFQGEANDPFLTGQVAMKIDGNWILNNVARFNPSLNFGTALAPTPDGSNKLTWSGGWSWAIPKNAKNAKEAFDAAKYMVTDGLKVKEDGIKAYNKSQGRPYVPGLWAYKPLNEQLIKENTDELNQISPNLGNAYKVCVEAMANSKARPVSPVGEILWTEHTRAIDKAIYKEMTPQEALDAGNKVVQSELDKFWADFKPAE